MKRTEFQSMRNEPVEEEEAPHDSNNNNKYDDDDTERRDDVVTTTTSGSHRSRLHGSQRYKNWQPFPPPSTNTNHPYFVGESSHSRDKYDHDPHGSRRSRTAPATRTIPHSTTTIQPRKVQSFRVPQQNHDEPRRQGAQDSSFRGVAATEQTDWTTFPPSTYHSYKNHKNHHESHGILQRPWRHHHHSKQGTTPAAHAPQSPGRTRAETQGRQQQQHEGVVPVMAPDMLSPPLPPHNAEEERLTHRDLVFSSSSSSYSANRDEENVLRQTSTSISWPDTVASISEEEEKEEEHGSGSSNNKEEEEEESTFAEATHVSAYSSGMAGIIQNGVIIQNDHHHHNNDDKKTNESEPNHSKDSSKQKYNHKNKNFSKETREPIGEDSNVSECGSWNDNEEQEDAQASESLSSRSNELRVEANPQGASYQDSFAATALPKKWNEGLPLTTKPETTQYSSSTSASQDQPQQKHPEPMHNRVASINQQSGSDSQSNADVALETVTGNGDKSSKTLDAMSKTDSGKGIRKLPRKKRDRFTAKRENGKQLGKGVSTKQTSKAKKRTEAEGGKGKRTGKERTRTLPPKSRMRFQSSSIGKHPIQQRNGISVRGETRQRMRMPSQNARATSTITESHLTQGNKASKKDHDSTLDAAAHSNRSTKSHDHDKLEDTVGTTIPATAMCVLPHVCISSGSQHSRTESDTIPETNTPTEEKQRRTKHSEIGGENDPVVVVVAAKQPCLMQDTANATASSRQPVKLLRLIDEEKERRFGSRLKRPACFTGLRFLAPRSSKATVRELELTDATTPSTFQSKNVTAQLPHDKDVSSSPRREQSEQSLPSVGSPEHVKHRKTSGDMSMSGGDASSCTDISKELVYRVETPSPVCHDVKCLDLSRRREEDPNGTAMPVMMWYRGDSTQDVDRKHVPISVFPRLAMFDDEAEEDDMKLNVHPCTDSENVPHVQVPASDDAASNHEKDCVPAQQHPHQEFDHISHDSPNTKASSGLEESVPSVILLDRKKTMLEMSTRNNKHDEKTSNPPEQDGEKTATSAPADLTSCIPLEGRLDRASNLSGMDSSHSRISSILALVSEDSVAMDHGETHVCHPMITPSSPPFQVDSQTRSLPRKAN